MSVYDKFEKYLPEMTEVRARYNTYLADNHLVKKSEDKLSDYLALVAASYEKQKFDYVFVPKDVPSVLAKPLSKEDLSLALVVLSRRLRQQPMMDKINGFSQPVRDELWSVPKENGCDREFGAYWFYKTFPFNKFRGMGGEEEKNVIRYALNVKPDVGLFQKLDDICLKYDVFNYKVAAEEDYNNRQDPIIIYARDRQKKEMQQDLLQLAKRYRRKDDYEMIGYQNLGDGLYGADEVKAQDVMALRMKLLKPDERLVFTQPLDDEWEQMDREYDLKAKLRKEKSLRGLLYGALCSVSYDNALSNGEFQVYQMTVNAYLKVESSQKLGICAKNAFER